MRIPNLHQMIDSVEADTAENISIESIVRKTLDARRDAITLDVLSGLGIIELQLQEYLQDKGENPTVDLRIIDDIDKWMYREKNIDIHRAAVSLVYEFIRSLSIVGQWDNYIHDGPYPPFLRYALPINALFDQIRHLKVGISYQYQGEMT